MSVNRDFTFSLFNDNYMLPLTEDTCETKEQILLTATLSFAKFGYTAVSMRQIAGSMGISPSSIYTYFESKEALWEEVVDHAGLLYTLYFERLRAKVASAGSFEEVMELIFFEPKRLLTVFTCYAFTMVQVEQFRDPLAGEIFEEIFMTKGIENMKEWFDKCIARDLVRAFDTQTVATIIMHSVLMSLQVEVHRLLNHKHKCPYEPRDMLQNLQSFIMKSVT